MKNAFKILLPGIVCVALDRISKLYIQTKLQGSNGVFIFNTKWLSMNFVYDLNDKLAFSIPTSKVVIILLVGLLLGLLLVLLLISLKQNKNVQAGLFFVIIVSAASNLLDRVAYGGVIDFVSLKFLSFNWAVFNLADLCIVGSVLILLIKEFNSPQLSKGGHIVTIL